MSAERVHRMQHQVTVAAPAGVVYGLIADAVRWPWYFSPSVHVEQLDFDGRHERLRMWATANGQVKSWTSCRELFPADWRLEFRQELPASPVQSMNGTWQVESRGEEECVLTLRHAFTVAADDPADVAWVERATDTNSRAELENLRGVAERWAELDQLVLVFEDSVRVNGPAELVYDLLYRAKDWPELLPHVSRLEVTEDQPGVQVMSMDTVTVDGTHTMDSVRICFPHAGRLVFKQTSPPELLAAHTGEWSVVPDETGVTVVAQHCVVLHKEAIEQALGPGADLARARRYVREALGRDSLTTLNLAKRHAETAVRVL